MSSERFDLHAHTTASDGTLAPRELVALAVERGLSGLAVTDHDTVDGLEEAIAMAQLLSVECIPGIELSCSSDLAGDVHLLGYFIDPADEGLLELISEMANDRIRRGVAIVDRVRELTGRLTMDDVLEESQGRAPGRPHIARAMVKCGIIGSVEEAFDGNWLTRGGQAFVPRTPLAVERAIAVVHRAGGAAVYAHPGSSRRAGGVPTEAVRQAAGFGLDGIEVDHPDHTDDAVRACVELAGELHLVQTSGSDDHGTGVDGPRLGCRTVSGRVVEALRSRAASRTAGRRV